MHREGIQIVCLEGSHCVVPDFEIPTPYSTTVHHTTQPGEVLERIRDATIAITTILPITPEVAAQCPKLELIVVAATGCGWVDKEGLAALGISVLNCPKSNIPVVSEHAMMLYLAARRKLVELHTTTISTTEWQENSSLGKRFPRPPRSCAEEDFLIIGHGNLGCKIESLARAMGVQRLMVAEHKGVAPPDVRPGRVALADALAKASVVMVCCPRDSSTIDLIGEQELRGMQRDAVLVNVARGGIVNEAALAKALRAGWIAGAATDVLDNEPGVLGGSPLLPADGRGVPGLTISPHLGWYAERTVKRLAELVAQGVEDWVVGLYTRCNFVVDARRPA